RLPVRSRGDLHLLGSAVRLAGLVGEVGAGGQGVGGAWRRRPARGPAAAQRTAPGAPAASPTCTSELCYCHHRATSLIAFMHSRTATSPPLCLIFDAIFVIMPRQKVLST